MISKNNLLDLIPRNYIEDVTLLINNSPRYEFLNADSDKQKKYFKRKYNVNELLEIYKNFISGMNPESSAKKIKTPDGFELTSRYIETLNDSIKVNTEFYFRNTKCDIVLFNEKTNEITSIETKAIGDSINKGIKQCISYSQYADYVLLLLDTKLYDKTLEIPTNIGIITIDDNSINMIVKPKKNKTKKSVYFENLTKNKLKYLCEIFNINKNGKKSDIKKRIIKNINLPLVYHESKKIFID